ncbi:hypothetical protein [Natroniella sp. ANB-PHB2]|uniref:hypothetical protein n=1 Tax=Natroniella sp. ANB-PHB2 TaxID=3384444 RepID=UPI0038D5152C
MRYELIKGTHSIPSDGGRTELTKGDIVELTESQYQSFKDKFRPAKGQQSKYGSNFSLDDLSQGEIEGLMEELKQKKSGWYELPNGENVQGQQKALEALVELKKEGDQ